MVERKYMTKDWSWCVKLYSFDLIVVDDWYIYKGKLKYKYVDDEVGFWVLIKTPSK